MVNQTKLSLEVIKMLQLVGFIYFLLKISFTYLREHESTSGVKRKGRSGPPDDQGAQSNPGS